MKKLLIPSIYLKDFSHPEEPGKVHKVIEMAGRAADSGADALYIYANPADDEQADFAISILRTLCNELDVPVYASVRSHRLEDIKKILYAGCEKAVFVIHPETPPELILEVSKRFGAERLIAYPDSYETYLPFRELIAGSFSLIMTTGDTRDAVEADRLLPSIFYGLSESNFSVLSDENNAGICANFLADTDIMAVKQALKENGLDVNVFESPIAFSDFKVNEAGLIPCIVTDVKDGSVLMMAWMNEESFNLTLKTGKMTYYSRSRQSLWVKGETSGHFQYVKAMSLDCDNDTLLAKVKQVGAACHTGSRSCFFREIVKDTAFRKNPGAVITELMEVIEDRKAHPKEGSYTNYLFDKGIDKILKKVGEECAEVIIAAKNPDRQEMIYEISDLLYHLCVLMSEKEVSWEEITRELARR